MNIFFIIQDFWATCAFPEKRSYLEFFTALKHFLSFRIFEQFALALKNRGCPDIFHCIWTYIFLSLRIFEQLALALKNRVAQKFFAVWNILFTFWILSNLRLPWKAVGSLNLLYRIYIFIIQDFLVTCTCLENQSCLGIFTVWNISYTFRSFE